MHRRAFIAATAAVPIIGPVGSRTSFAHAAEPNRAFVWRQFEIATTITLQNSSGPAQLWLPLAQTAAGYWSDWASLGNTGGTEYAIQLMVRRFYAAMGRKRDPYNTLRLGRLKIRHAPHYQRCQSAGRAMVVGPNERRRTVLCHGRTYRDGSHRPHRLRAIYDWVVTRRRNPLASGCASGGEFGQGLINGLMAWRGRPVSGP
jgi:hypothetical protein